MKYEGEPAGHKLSTSKRGSDVAYRRGPYWLDKRRDGRSDVWMVAWYEPKGRQVRYRSTRTRDLPSARIFLDAHALTSPVPEMHRSTEYREPETVYFVGGASGGIKIGIARDPLSRLVTLQCGSPIPIHIMALVQGGRATEREYHKRFAEHRLHGEWFARHPDILTEIERLSV